MSKNTGGILGGQQGKIGNVVAYIVDGQMRYRSYSEHHRKSNSAAAKQSRSRFATMSHMASKFGYLASFTLAYAAKRDHVSSTHHLFVRLNKGNFTADNEVDFANLTLGDGRMAPVSIDSIEVQAHDGTVARSIGFSTIGDGASFPTDMVFFALYFKEHDEIVVGSALRSQNETTLTSPRLFEADTKYLYAVAVNTREVETPVPDGIIHPKESSITLCVQL